MSVWFCCFQIKIQRPSIHMFVCASPSPHWDYRKVPGFWCGCWRSNSVFAFMACHTSSPTYFLNDLSLWLVDLDTFWWPRWKALLACLGSPFSCLGDQLRVTNNDGCPIKGERGGNGRDLRTSWCHLTKSKSRFAFSVSLCPLAWVWICAYPVGCLVTLSL